MTGQAEVVGADRLAATLAQFGRDVAALPDATHRAAAEPVRALAAGRARRLTGRLASSFTVVPNAAGAEVTSGVAYARVQELGWPARHITPSWALTSALADSTDAVAAVYTDAVDAALAHVKGAP